jgi:hypothetical protein
MEPNPFPQHFEPTITVDNVSAEERVAIDKIVCDHKDGKPLLEVSYARFTTAFTRTFTQAVAEE